MTSVEVVATVRAVDLWDRGRPHHTSGYFTVERALAEHLEVSAQGIVDYHERRQRSG